MIFVFKTTVSEIADVETLHSNKSEGKAFEHKKEAFTASFLCSDLF